MGCLTKSSRLSAQQGYPALLWYPPKIPNTGSQSLPAPSGSTKDMSWMGYGPARRLLLMALRSIEGTVQIQNTCDHLHYLVLENSQYFIGNVLDPMVPMSWSWRAFKHQVSALFFLCTYLK